MGVQILKEADRGASNPEQIFLVILFAGEVKSTNMFHHPSLMSVGVVSVLLQHLTSDRFGLCL